MLVLPKCFQTKRRLFPKTFRQINFIYYRKNKTKQTTILLTQLTRDLPQIRTNQSPVSDWGGIKIITGTRGQQFYKRVWLTELPHYQIHCGVLLLQKAVFLFQKAGFVLQKAVFLHQKVVLSWQKAVLCYWRDVLLCQSRVLSHRIYQDCDLQPTPPNTEGIVSVTNVHSQSNLWISISLTTHKTADFNFVSTFL